MEESPVLAGKRALVTGAAAGIGAGIGRRLLAAGADVALLDRTPVDLARFETHARSADQRILPLACDVLSATDVAAACDEVSAAFGGVDILVNNVGGSGRHPARRVEDLSDDIWDEVLALNLTSALRFARALVPGMKARGFGRIVNMSSTLKDGMTGPTDTMQAPLPYITAKSALVGFTRQLAIELGPFGITVNAIAPGLTIADPEARIAKRFAAMPEEKRRALTAGIPAGRAASAEDIAEVACFLASPASAYVSGQIIAVSGGA